MKQAVKLFLALALLAAPIFAVGTVTATCTQVGIPSAQVWLVTYSWTGDASTGTVPATASGCLPGLNKVQGYRVLSVEFKPGGTAPTNNYSATLADANSVDELAGAAAADLSSTTTNPFWPVYNFPLSGDLTLAITGNSVASATGTVYVTLVPGTMARLPPSIVPAYPGASMSASGQLAVNTTNARLVWGSGGTKVNGAYFVTASASPLALGTSAISAGTCATDVTVAATGVGTADTIIWNANADPSSANYAALTIYVFPTGNTINARVCNPSAGSVTPTALGLNWRVLR